MTEPTHELEAYFAGTADAEQLRTIEAWLHADPINASSFIEQLHFRELVGQYLREQRDETSAVLVELAQLEASADADTVTLVGQLPADPGSLSAHDLTAVGGYMLHKTLTNKRVITTGISAAAAAILLLVLVLANPFASDAPSPMVFDPQLPSADEAGQPAVVATLTAQHHAQWEQGAFAPGASLHAGQRLTLTHGFAEITTSRGAVAALEAPCAIELVDNDNALRLHHGKVLGICHTESSKGFVVLTTYADIKDLGTEFGVEAQHHKVTTTVFTGEVEMTPDGGETRPLVTNQTARLNTEIDALALAVEDQPAAGFNTLRNRPALSPADRWQQHLAQLDRAHGLIGQLSFDDQGPVATPGQNATTFDAKLVGGTIQPGDVSQGTAASLLINDNSHGVDLNFDPEVQHKQLTLVTWVRVNPIPGQEVAALFDLTSKVQLEDAQSPVWHLRYWEDAVYTGQRVHLLDKLVEGQRVDLKHKLRVAPLINDYQGQWRCYAVVLDTQSQTATHYIDGEPLGAYQSLNADPITLGSMRVGAVVESLSTRVNKTLHINGSCGLFLVLDHSLTADQIQLLHRASEGLFRQTL